MGVVRDCLGPPQPPCCPRSLGLLGSSNSLSAAAELALVGVRACGHPWNFRWMSCKAKDIFKHAVCGLTHRNLACTPPLTLGEHESGKGLEQAVGQSGPDGILEFTYGGRLSASRVG